MSTEEIAIFNKWKRLALLHEAECKLQPEGARFSETYQRIWNDIDAARADLRKYGEVIP